MLQHTYRFHGHQSIRRLYQHGQITRQRSLTLRYCENPSRVHSRAAVIVAKKVAKAAVKRNRIRRRIYEVLRLHWGEIKAPVDFSITVFDTSLLVMPPEEVERSVLSLLAEAGLLGSSGATGE